MPQSLARVVLHLVFSTKNRVPFLKEPDLRSRLHAYMAGILQKIGCEPILIGGVEDHVHALCNLSRTVTIAGLVEETKKSSSKWMKDQGSAFRDFYWQSGYGAFSVSQSNVEQVRAYVAMQKSITARCRSKRSSGLCAASTALRSTSVTFGTELPWPVRRLFRPVGARDRLGG